MLRRTVERFGRQFVEEAGGVVLGHRVVMLRRIENDQIVSLRG
ncbi:MAG: hypothetical protein WBW27_16500 [Pseudolabrys sp.]